jgi:hypothetical protein
MKATESKINLVLAVAVGFIVDLKRGLEKSSQKSYCLQMWECCDLFPPLFNKNSEIWRCFCLLANHNIWRHVSKDANKIHKALASSGNVVLSRPELGPHLKRVAFLFFFCSCIWTGAINGPLYIPQMIYEYGEPRRNDIDGGKSNNSEKNLSLCHSVQIKSHLGRPGREPRPATKKRNCTSTCYARTAFITRYTYFSNKFWKERILYFTTYMQSIQYFDVTKSSYWENVVK